MKKILYWTSQTLTIFAVFIGALYILKITTNTYPNIWNLLNTPFFSSVSTFLVGLIAYALYLKQKNDHKRDVAKLILQEIRYAEQKVREAKSANPPFTYKLTKLLPTNSWHNNINLFASDFKESDAIDTISRFYSQVALLDYLIENIAYQKFFTVTTVAPTPTQPVFIQPQLNQPGQPQPVQVFLPFKPSTAQEAIAEITQEIEPVYYSTAVEQLRRIADEK